MALKAQLGVRSNVPDYLKTTIILVRSQLGENIGMAARAMKNCGLSDLRLVDPRDGWPNSQADRASSGAMDIIENTKIYKTMADAVADMNTVYATTTRLRDNLLPVFEPSTMVDDIAKRHEEENIAIVFGPERTGLTAEDLTHADGILTIPLNPDYSSLNLAQAVLMVSYHLWVSSQSIKKARKECVPRADKAELETLIKHFLADLDQTSFFSNPNMREPLVTDLRHIFQRMGLSKREAQMWHGMLTALTGNKDWSN